MSRKIRCPRLSAPLWAGLFVMPVAMTVHPAQAQTERGQAMREKVNAAFGLRDSTIIELDAFSKDNGGVFSFVPLGDAPAFLNLEPHSVRAPGYQLLVQGDDGQLRSVDPGPERTLRGDVIGVPGAVAAGSLLDDGLHASIRFADGTSMWLEPIGSRVAGAKANQHVLYHNHDVIDEPKTCGANDMMRVARARPQQGGAGDSGEPPVAKAAAACIAQLACDADFEYFSRWGSSTAVQDQISNIISIMNVQYLRDVNITHTISAIVVRSSSADPYTSSDASTLLNQFRAEWETNQRGVVRDMAQLFTGRAVNGGTIGIAWIGAVCTNFGYSMVESDFNGTGSLACQTDLSAHEAGHNWGADHCGCQRPRPYTMNSFITCANQFHPKRTIPQIIAFRDSRTCLDDCGGDPPPPPPPGCTDAPAVGSHTCGPGAKRNDCLVINITITCDGSPLDAATVAVRLEGSTGDVLTGSATTNSSGQVSFKLRCKQAASPSYTSIVTSINGAAQTPTDPMVTTTGCDL